MHIAKIENLQTAENREDGSDFNDFWTESIAATRSIFSKIFARPKNREDGSDFDDFWTESIASTRSIFSKFLARPKKISRRRKNSI